MQRMIPVDGGEVWAQDTGGDGRPVVLLHAGWGDSSGWDPVIARLPAGTRVIRYDIRGYGRSPAPTGPYTELGDLARVLDQLDVQDVVLAGHSLGGATAVGLALAEPGRLSSLVLAAPGISDYPWSVHDAYFTGFEALFAAGDDEGLVGLGLRTWARAGATPDAEKQIRSAVAGFRAQGEWPRPDPPVLGWLAGIGVPAQVLIGDLDYPDVTGCARALAAGIPGCELIEVPGADHLLPLLVPGQLATLITARLS